MAFRHHHGGQRGRIGLRVQTDRLESPCLHGCTGRRAVTLVARPDILKSLLLEHRDRDLEAVEQIGGGRIGEGALLVDGDHVVPVPVGPRRRVGLRGGQRLFRDGVEAEAGRQHHALLRARDRHVDPPRVMLVFERRETRDRVDHQQRRMPGAVEDLADIQRMGDAARRGFVMHDHDGLDLVFAIRLEPLLDQIQRRAVPPVGRQHVDVEPELVGNAEPQRRELAGLGHQHLVARRQCVDDSRLPGAGTGRRIDDDRLLRAEHALNRRQHLMAEHGEFRAAMVEGRHVDGPQHPVGHVGGAWNLEKMPSCMQRHLASFPEEISWLGRGIKYHSSAGLSRAGGRSSIPAKCGDALQRRIADARQNAITRD